MVHAAARFALPALLPLISPDLKLDDSQGALLTVGYTVRTTARQSYACGQMAGGGSISLKCCLIRLGTHAWQQHAFQPLPPMQVLYALALIPVGFLADKVDRPRLLSGGLATWSLLTMAASKVGCSSSAHVEVLIRIMHHLRNVCYSICKYCMDLATFMLGLYDGIFSLRQAQSAARRA